jgi:ABC-type transport system involved in multi-copper enzyme maturation permease subunit
MVAWKEFFDIQVNENNETIKGSIEHVDKIVRSVTVLSIHIVLFFAASLWVFKKKDVLS